MSEEKKTTKVNVTGLWRNKGEKDGAEYFAGNWGNVRVLIFPNGYKEQEKDPDFYMYLAPRPRPTKQPAGNDGAVANEAEDRPF